MKKNKDIVYFSHILPKFIFKFPIHFLNASYICFYFILWLCIVCLYPSKYWRVFCLFWRSKWRCCILLPESSHLRLHLSLSLFLSCYLSRAAPTAYGGSQAKDLIRAVATGPRHSHSNTRSELCLHPTPQLTALLNPWPAEQVQGSNPQPHGS